MWRGFVLSQSWNVFQGWSAVRICRWWRLFALIFSVCALFRFLCVRDTCLDYNIVIYMTTGQLLAKYKVITQHHVTAPIPLNLMLPKKKLWVRWLGIDTRRLLPRIKHQHNTYSKTHKGAQPKREPTPLTDQTQNFKNWLSTYLEMTYFIFTHILTPAIARPTTTPWASWMHYGRRVALS